MSNNYPSYPSNNGSNPYNDDESNGSYGDGGGAYGSSHNSYGSGNYGSGSYGQGDSNPYRHAGNAQGYGQNDDQGAQGGASNYGQSSFSENNAQGGYGSYSPGQPGYGQNPHSAGGYEPFPTNGYGSHYSNTGYLGQHDRPGAGKRLLGFILDMIIVSFVVSLIMFVTHGDELMRYSNEIFSGNPMATLSTGVMFTQLVAGLVIWYLYRMGMELTKGGTLGKMAIGARVVKADGSELTAKDSFLRNSWYLIMQVVSMIPGLGLFLQLALYVALGVTISKDAARQSFTDKWGKTIVVSTR